MTADWMVPEGYEVVETDQIVEGVPVELYPARWAARRRAAQANERRMLPTYRYVAEPVGKAGRRRWHPLARWAVVCKQNVARRKDGASAPSTGYDVSNQGGDPS